MEDTIRDESGYYLRLGITRNTGTAPYEVMRSEGRSIFYILSFATGARLS